jgi:hypothetical protein
VDIFAHRDLSAFTAWSSKSAENAAYLNEQGIDVPKSVETMRLLTLCSLAAKEKNLSYDAISAGLQVSLRSPGQPPSSVRRAPRPPPKAILRMTIQQEFLVFEGSTTPSSRKGGRRRRTATMSNAFCI